MSIASAIADVAFFHWASDMQDIQPGEPAQLRFQEFRLRLIAEEYQEMLQALAAQDVVALTDAYVDLIYVILGAALQQVGRHRFIEAWAEVQRSNMAKCVDGKVIKRADGKILKPPGWTPPDLAPIVHGPELRCGPHPYREEGER